MEKETVAGHGARFEEDKNWWIEKDTTETRKEEDCKGCQSP